MFRNILTIVVLVPTSLLLSNCDNGPKGRPIKPGTYAFDVALKMSPKAEAVLKEPNAGLFVDIWYYGEAAPAHKGDADELNRVFLGKDDLTFSASTRRLHLKGEAIDSSKLAETRDGQPEVILTVDLTQGPRIGDPDNPLSCEYSGLISVAQRTPPVIQCEFETEHYWESVSDRSAGGS